MDDKNTYDGILIKYLANELTAEEKDLVVTWIEADRENRQYFEQLCEVWKLTGVKKSTDSIDVHEEWEHFKQSIQEIRSPHASDEEYSAPGKDVLDEPRQSKNFASRVFVYIAAAASILLVVVLAWALIKNKKENAPTIATIETDSPGVVLKTFVRNEINDTKKLKIVRLVDGSIVTLSPKSNIRLEEPFMNGRREVLLTGRAHFNVAENKLKPFRVISGNISTTALGTQFTVTAYQHSRNTTVRLYEGQVVVKQVSTARANVSNEFYLLPGQELVYDNNKSVAKVRTFKESKQEENDHAGADLMVDDNLSMPRGKKNSSWFMFNNQSLPLVFDQLKEMYNVEITYSKKEVSKMYFIGEFDKSDSVETILRQITTLNNLSITKENNRYIITK